MNKAFSLYLDVIRFGSAAAVFYYHASFQKFLAWLPWADVGHHAVIVFFVLSGLVIAHTTATKERTLRDYAAARFSRIYSVLLPVLLISIAAYLVGRAYNPAIYDDAQASVGQLWAAVPMNLLLLNEIWFFGPVTFSNTPIWSLCYEFWYYVLFGVLFFTKSVRWRVLLFAALGLALGPKILVLFPIWLLGFYLYRRLSTVQLRPVAAISCLTLPLIVYLATYFLGVRVAVIEMVAALVGDRLYALEWSHQFAFDYFIASLICLHFVGAWAICRRNPQLLAGLEKPIRWLAGHTFTLYLAHYPLLHFFAAVLNHDPSNKLAGLLLVSAVLVAIVVIAHFTENKRHVLKNVALRLTSGARPIAQSASTG